MNGRNADISQLSNGDPCKFGSLEKCCVAAVPAVVVVDLAACAGGILRLIPPSKRNVCINVLIFFADFCVIFFSILYLLPTIAYAYGCQRIWEGARILNSGPL